MKKLLIFCLIVLIITGTLAFASAQEMPYFNDFCGILSDAEAENTEQKCAKAGDEYGADIVIVITDDSEGKTAEQYADDFYDYNGYDKSDTRGGVILAVCMDTREYSIVTTGKAIQAFSLSDIETIYDDMEYYMRNEEYTAAFDTYINDVSYKIAQANGIEYKEETPASLEKTPNPAVNAGIALAIGFIISLVAVLFMRAQLKSKRMRRDADPYIKEGSLDIKESYDMFLYSSITKVRINNNSGNGTHIGSSGTPHGGGGGRHF